MLFLQIIFSIQSFLAWSLFSFLNRVLSSSVAATFRLSGELFPQFLSYLMAFLMTQQTNDIFNVGFLCTPIFTNFC